MKSLYHIYLISAILLSFFFTGCELFTKPPAANRMPPQGKDLNITEIFTLSPDKYYNYSWIEVYNPTPATFNWFYETFPAIAMVVGENGTFITTDDDGETWATIPTNLPNNESLYALGFNVPDSGIVVGQNGIILKVRRNNFSTTINPTPVPNPDPLKKTLRSIYMVPAQGYNAKGGFIVGDSGTVLWTTNRGVSWRPYLKGQDINNRATPFNLNAISYVNQDRIYAVGDSGTVLKSPTAFQWDRKPLPDDVPPKTNFYSCGFIWDTGFVVGEKGVIISTRNAGETWYKQESVVPYTLRSIFMSRESGFNYREAWVVGDNGTVLKTTNFGRSWLKKETSVNFTLRKVNFVDARRGLAFGDGGAIIQTFDGGETWSTIHTSGTTNNLYGTFFNQPDVRIRNRYVLEMWGQRYHFKFDLPDTANPYTAIINYDLIYDTIPGVILFDPAINRDLRQLYRDKFSAYRDSMPSNFYPIFNKWMIDSVVPGGFTIISNDSERFSNHTKLGPGQVNVATANIGFIKPNYSGVTDQHDINNFNKHFGVSWFRWSLLPSSEIRLVKYLIKENIKTHIVVGYDRKIIIDVVRWGNPSDLPSSWYLATDPMYPNNTPAGLIPEWYSLARYANDVGSTDVNKLKTSESFYFAKDPIPGWYSQRRK